MVVAGRIKKSKYQTAISTFVYIKIELEKS
jgi:hypothetical protein